VFLDYFLDHIGIAVTTLAEGSAFYEALGLSQMKTETVASEQVKVGMYELENGTRLELLEPTSETSPIAKFLKTRGPGIHHICLRVDNIKSTCENLRKKNVRLIYDEPRVGAHNRLINFVHPASTGGVLIELSQAQ
jgi:methylmalonyl-CoA epimerase